jgi:type IV pilus assembly protein PilZ
MQGQERRQHVRHRTWRVEVKVASAEAFCASYLRDVSDGGLFVRSRTPLPVGARVVVELLVASQVLRLPGVVVRIEPGGFGVGFDALDEGQRAQLAALATASRTSAIASATALAEARGVIEAYEETLASLKEAEAMATERAELAAFECSVVVERLRQLEARLAGVLAENAKLVAALRTAEAELDVLRRVSAPPPVREVAPGQAVAQEFDRLRAEVRELTSELDDERLKAIALQRALQRFQAMGGVIPKSPPPPG